MVLGGGSLTVFLAKKGGVTYLGGSLIPYFSVQLYSCMYTICELLAGNADAGSMRGCDPISDNLDARWTGGSTRSLCLSGGQA